MSLRIGLNRVHVQVSPAPSTGRFHASDVLLLGGREAPNFVDLNALRLTFRTFASWKPAQKLRRISKSFDDGIYGTSASRETDRIEAPSQSIERIWARWQREACSCRA